MQKSAVPSKVMLLKGRPIACFPLLLHRGRICVEFLSSKLSNLFKTTLELKLFKCLEMDYS